MTLITGNTYPVKDALKALGGKWDPDKKGWKVPDEKAEEARRLVAGAPRSPRSTASRSGGYRSGRRTGCSCGSREDSAGELIYSPHNCASCNFDGYDN